MEVSDAVSFRGAAIVNVFGECGWGGRAGAHDGACRKWESVQLGWVGLFAFFNDISKSKIKAWAYFPLESYHSVHLFYRALVKYVSCFTQIYYYLYLLQLDDQYW